MHFSVCKFSVGKAPRSPSTSHICFGSLTPPPIIICFRHLCVLSLYLHLGECLCHCLCFHLHVCVCVLVSVFCMLHYLNMSLCVSLCVCACVCVSILSLALNSTTFLPCTWGLRHKWSRSTITGGLAEKQLPNPH